METFKQFDRRIKKLEKKVLALTDKAMTGQSGLKVVMEEIGQLNIKAAPRLMSCRQLLTALLRRVAFAIWLSMGRLQGWQSLSR
jgi:hypothetical protein